MLKVIYCWYLEEFYMLLLSLKWTYFCKLNAVYHTHWLAWKGGITASKADYIEQILTRISEECVDDTLMQQASVQFLSPGLWTNECFFMKNDLVKFHERECDKFPFRVVMNVGPQIVKSSKQCVHEAFLDISFQIRDSTILTWILLKALQFIWKCIWTPSLFNTKLQTDSHCCLSLTFTL